MKVRLLAFFLLLGITFLSVKGQDISDFKIVKGELDLQNWSPQQNPIIELNGEWEFYPNQLLTLQDFKKHQIPLYLKVPGFWNDILVNDKSFGSEGFATYRLKIFLPITQQDIALRLLTISTAAKVFVNDSLLTEIGKVTKIKEGSVPEYYPQVLRLPKGRKEINIIIQVSNFYRNKAGIAKKIELGLEKELRKEQQSEIRLESFFWGGFLSFGVYFIFISLRRRQGNQTVFLFGLTSLSVSLRMMAVGEVFASPLGWFFVIHAEFLGFFLSPFLFLLFLKYLFPDDYNDKIIKVLSAIYIIFIGILIFTPPTIFTSITRYFQIFILLSFLYKIIGIVRAFYFKRQSSYLIFFPFLFVLFAVIHDILYTSGFFLSFQLVPWSLFVFCIVQAISLSYRFFSILSINEKLRVELENTNQNLEEIVQTRTEKLEKTNQELVVREEELSQQNEKLIEITKQISSQKDILQKQKIQTDRLYKKVSDSINAAQQIQQAIFPTEEKMNDLFREYFVFFKPKDVVSGDFYFVEKIENKVILAVADCTGHGVPGAFMTLIGFDALSNIINQKKVLEPHFILEELHTEVFTKLRQYETGNSEGMDVSVLVFETVANENKTKLSFAGAKNDFYLVKKNQPSKIENIRGTRRGIAGNQVVGIDFTPESFFLENGDMIYVGTDGYEDQNDEKRKKFGRQRFSELLLEISQEKLEKQASFLEKTLDNYMKNTTQRDDILWLGIRV